MKSRIDSINGAKPNVSGGPATGFWERKNMSHGESSLYLPAVKVYCGVKGNQELGKPCLRKSNQITTLAIKT